MQTGVIRRRDSSDVLGRWCADAASIVVETNDPALRSASDQILRTPQRIPIHGVERREFATHGESLTEHPMRDWLKRQGFATTVHGLRSSFRDWAREQRRDIKYATAHFADSINSIPTEDEQLIADLAYREAKEFITAFHAKGSVNRLAQALKTKCAS